jgi:hypothetical protein
MDNIDYATTNLNISQAAIEQVRKFPNKALRPDHINWNGIRVQTYDWWGVPKSGTLRLEFIGSVGDVEQGVDIKLEGGGVIIASGEKIPVLRTWKDDRYEDVVEYSYTTETGRICIWNVYKTKLPNGEIREDKWSGNSGFWVELVGEHQRIYHCSHGDNAKPDFESLVFRVTLTPNE